MNTQFKKGALELCVLSQLAQGDKYGYELTERISGEMSIASGTLYPILRKLKDDNHVTTYLVESESGPARKYYRLTDGGRKYQRDVKAEWERFTASVNRLIAKTPEISKEPEMPKRPEVPEEPEMSKRPEASKEPEMSKRPEASKEPEMPKRPEAPDEPQESEEIEELLRAARNLATVVKNNVRD